MNAKRDDLVERTNEFMEAFNRNDLDAVMGFFSEDAVYDEIQGTRNEGKEAIRAAFEPQFRGEFGVMEFVDDDLFVDDDAGKVMTSWLLRMERDGTTTSFRGLDLLHFENGLIVRKLTYTKAQMPLLEEL